VTENLSPLGSRIPLLETPAMLALLAPLLAAAAAGGNTTATLSVAALDVNEWLRNKSLDQPLAVTVLAAAYGALAWLTYSRAFLPLLALDRVELLARVRKVMVLYLSALIVLATCALTLVQLVLGLYPTGALLIWGHGVLPEPPFSLQQALEPVVLGLDSFTTLMLVLHWNEMRAATIEERPIGNVLSTRKCVAAACLVVSFVPTLVKSIPGALYINSASLGAVTGMFSLLVTCSSAWMLWSLARFRATAVDIIGVIPPLVAAWLFWAQILSALNLLLLAIIMGMLQLNVPYRPDIAVLWIFSLYLTICAITFCKLNCIAPNAAGLQSTGKTVMRSSSKSRSASSGTSKKIWLSFSRSVGSVAPAPARYEAASSQALDAPSLVASSAP
jgi:hypothetical protein